MKGTSRVLRWIPALALVIGFAACGDAGTPDHGLLGPGQGRASLNLGSGVTGYVSKDDPRLLAWLESEKLRIAQEQEAGKGQYDALKVEWQKWLDSGGTSTNGRAVACDPYQYVATTKIVGPEGEELGFGPHKLTIPRGALKHYVVVTAEAPVSLSVKTRFRPHGITFGRQVRLHMSYAHCQGDVASLKKQVAYVDLFNNVLEWETSQDFPSAKFMYGWTWHFSDYMLAIP